MTDQLKIDAMNSVAMMANPATVVSWKANSNPPEAMPAGKRRVAMAIDTRTRGAACKILGIILAAWLAAAPGRAAEGAPYDVFGRALAPIAAAVFGGVDGRIPAMVAECTATGGTGALAAANGTHFRIALQSAERVRIDVVRDGTKLTACRHGGEFWAAPAAAFRPLLEAAGIELGSSDGEQTPAPLVPVALHPQMLAFLPMVFDVKDLGLEETPSKQRVLEFGLLPAITEAVQARPFTGRAWIGGDYRPSRLLIAVDDGTLEIVVDRLDYAESLPDTAWEPPADEDVLRLPSGAFNDVFEAMIAPPQATAP